MLSDHQDHPSETAQPYGYEPPVSKLLTLGERPLRGPRPFDYSSHGINESHLVELARMSRDASLNEAASNTLEVWAPIHAMRALIQIGTEATIEPLACLLEYDADADYDEIDDWPLEEIPRAFGQMGAAAAPRCLQLLRDQSKHIHSRLAAAVALEKMAEQNPDLRGEAVAAIARELQSFDDNEPEWNGWLVSELIHLKAVEAADRIQQAFDADQVDETIVGDWDEVQAALGLRGPLTDAELAQKAANRQAAHGWISPQEMLDEEDQELLEEMSQDWEDSGTEAWTRLASQAELDEQHPRMIMPDEMYSPEQRRELAKQRNKERKAADRAKQRDKQNKRRH
jgi:hypothetical protein